MIELHGVAASRVFRNLWMLEEIGVAYQHVPTPFLDGALESEAFSALNPNRKIPCLVDGELRMFESLAINLYLARRYAPALWPATIEDEARVYQWTLWAANELEPHLSAIAFQQNRVPEPERDHGVIRAAEAALPRPLGVLDAALAGRSALVGHDFGVADLNVASVLATAVTTRTDFSRFEGVSAWFRCCLGRPAGRRAAAMAQA